MGRKKLTQLTADDIDDLLAARAAAGAARNTVIRFRSALVMALDQAVRRNLVFRKRGGADRHTGRADKGGTFTPSTRRSH